MADTVETFRRIAWIIFKWGFFAVLAIALLIGGIIGIANLSEWYSYSRHLEQVEITVDPTHERCKDDKWPLWVAIINRSTRTIEKVNFDLAARVKGRSTDIAGYHDYPDDHIIPPKEGFAICWAAPELKEKADPRALDWSIKYRRVRFQD